LNDAVSSRRLDLVELLLANGADIKAISLADVLLSWEPRLIHFFLDHGADPLEGRPFAVAWRKSPDSTSAFCGVQAGASRVAIATAGTARLRSPLFLRRGKPEVGQPAHMGGRRSPFPWALPGEGIHRRPPKTIRAGPGTRALGEARSRTRRCRKTSPAQAR
jgi:hypothetical protein